MITLRNPRDGSTVDADPADTDRLNRLAKLGYRPVGKPPATPPVKKVAARKRAATK